MSNITSINKIRNEQQDRENNTFAIREDDGELKDIEDWTGDDWEDLVEGVFGEMSARYGVSKWDIFADFIRSILTDNLEEIKE